VRRVVREPEPIGGPGRDGARRRFLERRHEGGVGDEQVVVPIGGERPPGAAVGATHGSPAVRRVTDAAFPTVGTTV
jgi:hypothetical protein